MSIAVKKYLLDLSVAMVVLAGLLVVSNMAVKQAFIPAWAETSVLLLPLLALGLLAKAIYDFAKTMDAEKRAITLSIIPLIVCVIGSTIIVNI